MVWCHGGDSQRAGRCSDIEGACDWRCVDKCMIKFASTGMDSLPDRVELYLEWLEG